jgi:hypothetical protein
MTADAAILVVAAGLFVWALAEAISWPVVPDAPMAVVVFLIPDAAALSVAAIVFGSVLGGAVGIALRRRGLTWPLPLVTTAMTTRVSRWLEGGALGLRHQPLTAVPYKVFVVEAGRRNIGQVPWALATGVFRGLRMTAVALLAVGAQALVAGWAAPDNVIVVEALVLGGAAVVFFAGWRLTVVIWRRSSDELDVAPDS